MSKELVITTRLEYFLKTLDVSKLEKRETISSTEWFATTNSIDKVCIAKLCKEDGINVFYVGKGD